jgi:hypothetical protein
MKIVHFELKMIHFRWKWSKFGLRPKCGFFDQNGPFSVESKKGHFLVHFRSILDQKWSKSSDFDQKSSIFVDFSSKIVQKVTFLVQFSLDRKNDHFGPKHTFLSFGGFWSKIHRFRWNRTIFNENRLNLMISNL